MVVKELQFFQTNIATIHKHVARVLAEPLLVKQQQSQMEKDFAMLKKLLES